MDYKWFSFSKAASDLQTASHSSFLKISPRQAGQQRLYYRASLKVSCKIYACNGFSTCASVVLWLCPWQRRECVLQKTISTHMCSSAPSSNKLHSQKMVLYSRSQFCTASWRETVSATELTSSSMECFVKYVPSHLSPQASYLNISATISWKDSKNSMH